VGNFLISSFKFKIKILKNTVLLLEERNAGLMHESAKTLLNNLPNIEKFKNPFNLVTYTNGDNNDQVSNVFKESNKLLKVSLIFSFRGRMVLSYVRLYFCLL
jgi:hypothetical protein